MKEITPTELKAKLDANEDLQLIDVREQYEADICSIGGDLIPMGEMMTDLDKVRKEGTVVVHCKTGGRSGAVISALEGQGYSNLINLKGGIFAWIDEVDPTLEKY